MDKTELQSLVERRLSIRQIASNTGVSFTTVRYWLKVHGLRTYSGAHGAKPKDYQIPRHCYVCGERDTEKFYGRQTTQCAHCRNTESIQRQHKLRERALLYLGNRCTKCGYHEYPCALDLHHVDAGQKDVAFRTWRTWSWERLEIELQKCILLCKNCHAVEHYLLRGMAQSG